MAQGPDSGGLRGPERPRTSTPSPRPETEPVAGRGGAYSAPPPADTPGGPGGKPRATPWWLLGAVAVVLVGGMLYRNSATDAPVSPPAIEQVTPAASQVLVLGVADIDQPATDLAKALLAGGALPAPPPGPAPAMAPTDPPAPAPSATPAATPAPAIAQPATATPQPAPVVRRPKPAANAPKTSAPVPAPAAETEQAVRQVLAQAPAETRAAIADGNQVIYSLHVLDDVVEDGDIVEIFVNGTSYGRVLLASGGQDVLIPLPVGTTARVHVVAVEDGGGGVTFGVTTSQGEIRSTVMPQGGSDDWSVTIQ